LKVELSTFVNLLKLSMFINFGWDCRLCFFSEDDWVWFTNDSTANYSWISYFLKWWVYSLFYSIIKSFFNGRVSS
jgi:hypothetical protein